MPHVESDMGEGGTMYAEVSEMQLLRSAENSTGRLPAALP